MMDDPARARAEIEARRPDILALFQRRRALLAENFGTMVADAWDRAESALCLSLTRLAIRHGRFGQDYHHYHNEEHALEILDRRIERVMRELGIKALTGLDWVALTLFATCHDLRQRELVDSGHPVGSNEAASIAETERILDRCGFDRVRDHELYLALEIMIAGSTFDARPAPMDRSKFNTAEAVTTTGPLAPHLARELDRINPAWRSEPSLDRAIRLALIASDLDTANVGESFVELSDSGARLAGEREMRAGRSLESTDAGPPLLGFLTTGQERYFFELHRFCSDVGERVYGPGKAANAEKVRAISVQLRERFRDREPGSYTGVDVLDAQREMVWQLA
ncbi:MAG: hypothetical protein IPK97_11105 [Ahniella sp.]|nr:hypothetical protein [Ahniella sp.]